MQGISYIIDQGPENSNWMWWISLENINGKAQKILRAGGSSVIWDQRKKGQAENSVYYWICAQ